MSYTLAQIRDAVLRRRIAHPVPSEINAEATSMALQRCAAELGALVGKISAGMIDNSAAKIWAGRAQTQLSLLAHMFGVDLDDAVFDVMNSRGDGPTIAPPHPAIVTTSQAKRGRFRVSRRLWLDQPHVVQAILQRVFVQSIQVEQGNPRAWVITALGEDFRRMEPDEKEIPAYSVEIHDDNDRTIRSIKFTEATKD